MIKNYFRILKNPHAYLQAILKAHVKFQKDRPKTVGGVKGTRFLTDLGFNDMSTLVGHFVSSNRKREKRDRIGSRGEGREGQE